MAATSTAYEMPLARPAHFRGRDFLTFLEFSPDELMELIALASRLKDLKRRRIQHRLLEGRSIALYFEKPSSRTRVSFEVGISDLGAHPFMLRKEEINLGVRECIADVARTMERFVDGVMIRTFGHNDVVEFAKHATKIPVINGLTDDHHPCQVLADLLTMQERFGNLQGRTLTYVGDGANNMAHSLLLGCALVGMNVNIATPQNYLPAHAIVGEAESIARKQGGKIQVSDRIDDLVAGADVLYTDVWTSMGQEAEAEARRDIFRAYQINDVMLSKAAPQAIVLHCLPAHRGEEVTAEVMDRFADVIFDEAENRLHAQKAILAALVE